jgi:hypothetical protein
MNYLPTSDVGRTTATPKTSSRGRSGAALPFRHSVEQIVPILRSKIEDLRFSKVKIGTWFVFGIMSPTKNKICDTK